MTYQRKSSDAEIQRLLRPYILRQNKMRREALYPWIMALCTLALLLACALTLCIFLLVA